MRSFLLSTFFSFCILLYFFRCCRSYFVMLNIESESQYICIAYIKYIKRKRSAKIMYTHSTRHCDCFLSLIFCNTFNIHSFKFHDLCEPVPVNSSEEDAITWLNIFNVLTKTGQNILNSFNTFALFLRLSFSLFPPFQCPRPTFLIWWCLQRYWILPWQYNVCALIYQAWYHSLFLSLCYDLRFVRSQLKTTYQQWANDRQKKNRKKRRKAMFQTKKIPKKPYSSHP